MFPSLGPVNSSLEMFPNKEFKLEKTQEAKELPSDLTDSP